MDRFRRAILSLEFKKNGSDISSKSLSDNKCTRCLLCLTRKQGGLQVLIPETLFLRTGYRAVSDPWVPLPWAPSWPRAQHLCLNATPRTAQPGLSLQNLSRVPLGCTIQAASLWAGATFLYLNTFRQLLSFSDQFSTLQPEWSFKNTNLIMSFHLTTV